MSLCSYLGFCEISKAVFRPPFFDIKAGTRLVWIIVVVPQDFFDRIDLRQAVDELRQRVPLVRGKLIGPDHADPYGMRVVSGAMGADFTQVPTAVNAAVQVNHIVVADMLEPLMTDRIRPHEAPLFVPLINLIDRHMAEIRRSGAMNDNAVDSPIGHSSAPRRLYG